MSILASSVRPPVPSSCSIIRSATKTVELQHLPFGHQYRRAAASSVQKLKTIELQQQPFGHQYVELPETPAVFFPWVVVSIACRNRHTHPRRITCFISYMQCRHSLARFLSKPRLHGLAQPVGYSWLLHKPATLVDAQKMYDIDIEILHILIKTN